MFIIKNALRGFRIQGALMSFYAVARGHQVGIYESWAQCEAQVKGFKGARYKKFNTREQAQAFLEQTTTAATTPSSRHVGGIKVAEKRGSSSKDYWPQNDGDQFDENAISEAEMLAAAAAVEDSISRPKGSRKRKIPGCGLPPDQTSDFSITVGQTNIGTYRFDTDIENYVIVYTDGSCINNGRDNASAGYGVYFGEEHPLNAARPVDNRVTNNVGEIQAAIYAIKVAKKVGIKKLCINTDSQFLINAITMWVKAWKRSDWRLKSGEPVKNQVDFKELDELLMDDSLLVKWNYVQGHAGIKGNVMADKLAREGAEIYRRLHKMVNL